MATGNNALCDKFERLLWAFIDGDMPERERIFWEQHLGVCDQCSAKRDEARAVELAYGRIPDQEPSESLLSELLERVYSPGYLRRAYQRLTKRLPGRRIWKSSLVGAVVLLGGVLLFTVFRQRRSA